MIKQKHKGAHTELTAAAWLLSQGYEVFRNVSGFGEIDLVAIKGQEIRLFDAKTSYEGGSPHDHIEYISPLADGTFRITGRRNTQLKVKIRELTPREIVVRKLNAMAGGCTTEPNQLEKAQSQKSAST